MLRAHVSSLRGWGLSLALLLLAGPASAAVQRLGTAPPSTSPIITFSERAPNGALLNYLKPNPVFNFTNVGTLGNVTVRFGSMFAGQQAGSMYNSLVDTSPSGPLQLAANAPKVGVLLDNWASDKLVLGGMNLAQYRFFTTPIAIHFSVPVNWVGFDVGSFDHNGTTVIEAYDANGASLGTWQNNVVQGGTENVFLRDTLGQRNISGISIYVPADGMDWEGFAVDNVRFGDGNGLPIFPPDGEGPDPNVVPEPGTWLIWFVLAGGAGLVSRLRRPRAVRS